MKPHIPSRSPFILYVDRLKNEEVEHISEQVDPSFMDVAEKELVFSDNVYVSGKAYLTDSHVILDLKLKAYAKLPCSICNELFSTPIVIEKFSHAQDLSEVKGAIYSYEDEIRSALLLKLPLYNECSNGNCPERKEISKHFKKPCSDTHTPFSDLTHGD